MGTEKSSSSTGVFLAHLVVLAAVIVAFTLMYLAYVDTKWMKAETHYEVKENRKLRDELTELKKELKDKK